MTLRRKPACFKCRRIAWRKAKIKRKPLLIHPVCMEDECERNIYAPPFCCIATVIPSHAEEEGALSQRCLPPSFVRERCTTWSECYSDARESELNSPSCFSLWLSLILLPRLSLWLLHCILSLWKNHSNIDISHFLYILYRWETWPTSSTCTSFCYVIISIFPCPLSLFLIAVNVVQRLSLVFIDSYCVFLSSLPACSSSYLLDMILSHCLDCNIYHVISALWKLIHPWL